MLHEAFLYETIAMKSRIINPKEFSTLQVMILKSQREVDHIPTPAITIFARQHQGTAWKNQLPGEVSQDNILKHECGNETETLKECIQMKTYDFSEVVHDANLWYLGRWSKRLSCLTQKSLVFLHVH